ncbi:MAG: 50S ribosomal protein L15 [Nitrospira sp.]|nr:50S ribosomal protein L15 [Nitrospira sp.]
MKLHELKPQPGAKKKQKRVGRGPGSGHGKTSTRGHKGQGARSGGTKGPGFEGGQQPLIRRIPKRGFKYIFRKEYAIVNLSDLGRFDKNQQITPELLKVTGVIRKSAAAVKVLGDGEVMKPLNIVAHKFSQGALAKIQSAGGKVEVIQGV